MKTAPINKAIAICAVLLALGTGVQAAETPQARPQDCLLATIDGVAVNQSDADAIRALLQPPPAAAATRRLAVDAALAWWDIHGWLAGSSARGRLDAWRAWLSVGTSTHVEALDVRRAASDIADVAARAALVPGDCADPSATTAAVSGSARGESPQVGERGRRAAALLVRSIAELEALPVLMLRLAPTTSIPVVDEAVDHAVLNDIVTHLRSAGYPADLQEVSVPPRQLESKLALALVGLPRGASTGPIQTTSGIFWLERR